MALHGFSGAGLDFESLIPELREIGHFVAPDLPGHGTHLSSSATADDWVSGLHEFASETFRRPFLILGYSMGGRLALHFALRYPHLVDGLILVGATAGIEDGSEREVRQENDETLAAWIEANGVEAFCERWATTPIIATQENIPSPYGEALRVRKERLSIDGLSRTLRTVGTGVIPSVWKRLGEIDVPTLVMAGENDAKYRAIGVELARQLPHAEMNIVDKAGHAAHLEESWESARLMLEFLRREQLL